MWLEWLRLPAGTLELLIEYRSYAAAYATFRANPEATSELVDLVKAIEFALVQEELDAEHVHD
jgi:hypothetical protein